MEWVDVKLQAELADAARRLARERDVTVSQLLRDLVVNELRRKQRARPTVRADERLVAPLRARLAGDLAHARNWEDLKNRLNGKGYLLVASGGGLALHAIATGRRGCKASDLGFSYGRLVERMGTAFPGQPRPSFGPDRRDSFAIAPNRPHRAVRDITDEFDVIEPF